MNLEIIIQKIEEAANLPKTERGLIQKPLLREYFRYDPKPEVAVIRRLYDVVIIKLPESDWDIPETPDYALFNLKRFASN